MRSILVAALAFGAAAGFAKAAAASETIAYSYDARGRLIALTRSGSVNDGVTTSYSYDDADNRTAFVAASGGGGGTGDCSAIAFTVPSDGAVTEGGSAVFTIGKSGAASVSCSVAYATFDGTATAGSDYSAKSGILTFGASDTSLPLSVQTTDDSVHENAETFGLALSNPSGGAVVGTPRSATATIEDNDSANSPPVTQPDSVRIGCNVTTTVNVAANDSDAEGNTPLTVTSVHLDSLTARASVVSASSIQVTGADGNETSSGTYTVEDSLGASSTGALTVESVGGPSICAY